MAAMGSRGLPMATTFLRKGNLMRHIHAFRLAAGFTGVLILGLALATGANAAITQVPVKDFARHAPISDPVLSPDGKHLAVVVHNKSGRYQLAVLDLPGLKPMSRLNMSPHNVPIDITWVNNKRLVMDIARLTGSLNKPQGTGDVISVNIDGSNKQILYSAHLRDPTTDPHVLSMPRGAAGIVGAREPANGHVYIAVHPFMHHLSYGNRDHGRSLLYDVNAANGATTLVGRINHPGMNFVLYHNVARYAFGSSQADPYRIIVYYRANRGKPWHRLSKSIGKRFIPLYIMPDGKHVYALYSAKGGPNQLVKANLDGSHLQVVASNPFASVAGVMHTPYPFKPFAVTYDTRKPRVQYVSDDIYARIQQALAAKFKHKFISIAGMSRNGSIMLIHAYSDRDPGSYALFNRKTMHLSPLFQVLPWINPKLMAHRKPIQFTSSSGMQLTGFLTLPLGSDGKDLPMILIPHGGPIGVADHWGWMPWAQFLANRGYAVLQVNYRGSGGRGAHFEHAGYKEFGTGIQQDLIDGVKWAIQQGIADPDRICIYGGSFGGYSALMAPIRAPHLFQCSVDYAGISNYAIEFNRSDTSRMAAGRNYFKRAIGTSEATIHAISPIYHLDRFNIPVLIVHGKDDPRVPFKNATELRDALEKAGKPFEWLVRDKEQHGFYSVANNIALLTTMAKFFRKYIGPGTTK